MGEGRRPRATARAARGERLVGRLEGRLGAGKSVKAGLRRVFPDHWSLMLGEISLYSFVVLVITGVYLTLYFHPSMNMVEYHGSYGPLRGQMVSEAFDSTLHISFDVRGGLLMRQVHHWAALIFVGALLAQMMRVFFTGAFRRPREISWLAGLALLVLAMFAGLTGYDLPYDLLSGTGLAVVNGTLLSVPVVGTYLSMFLSGGQFPGTDIVARFDTLHVLLLPGLIAGLMAFSVILTLRHGQSQYPGPGRTEKNIVGLPLRVRAVKSAGCFVLTCGVLFFMGAIAQVNPVWDYGPYRADQVSTGSQPDWYMAVADGLLRVMPGWEITFWGHTLALGNLVPLLAGVGLFLAMAVYPFAESRITGDDREHHLLDRPRNRPVRTGLGAAWLSVYVVAVAGAANDIIATQFHLSVNAVTWAVRVGLFVAPVAVFEVTRRIALGLQLRDRAEVLHGRETGVIKRMPNGGYVEVHEPLNPERLHVLTAREPTGPPLQRQALLRRGFHGTGAQVAEATADRHERAAEERER